MHPARLLASALLVAALTVPAWALEGRILLPDGTPARGATVSILGLPGTARTGPDGRFTWQPDPPLPFSVLVVRSDGVLGAPVLVESLPPDGALILELAGLSESLTVAAGATPHTDAPPAAAADVVGAEQIARRNARNVVEVLEAVPGADRLGGGMTAVPSLRGLARGRTLILIDGARVSTERRAGPSATYLDPFQLEALEVSRGLGSVVYGSDAFGGVIHARTRRAAEGEGWGGRAQLGAGAGRPEWSARGELSHGTAEGGLLAQGRLRQLGDYDSPDGHVPFSSAEDAGLALRFHHALGPGLLEAGWQTDAGRDIERPAADIDVVRTRYPVEDSHRFTAGFEADPCWSLSRLGAEVFLGSYRLVTEREQLATEVMPGSLASSDVSAEDYGLRLGASRYVSSWRLSGGLDLNGRTGLEALESSQVLLPGVPPVEHSATSIEDASRRDLGLHVSIVGAPLARLAVSGGLRWDELTSRNSGGHFGDQQTSEDALSGYASLSAGPWARTTLTGQVGWGFRDPTLSDRYFRGVTGRGFVTGNPDLQPEQSLQYDVALRRSGRVRAAAYLYRYLITDLVERYRDGADFFFRNRGEALIEGLELELATQLESGLRIDLGAHVVRGRARDDDSALADIPATAATLTLGRDVGRAGDAWLRLRGVLSDDEPGPTEQATPGYVTLDAAYGHRFGESVEARLALQNLFDARYPDGPDEQAPQAPGRAAMLTLSVVF